METNLRIFSSINPILDFKESPSSKSESSSIAELGKKMIGYSLDSESIETGRIPLKRERSSPDLEREKSQKRESLSISDLSGAMWTCLERLPDPKSPGFLYLFKIKEEFDYVTDYKKKPIKQIEEHFTKKNEENFPVIEPSPFFILNLDPKITLNRFRKLALKIFESAHSPKEEWTSQEVLEAYDRKNSIERGFEEDFKHKERIHALGYEVKRKNKGEEGIYLFLPDRIALMGRWQQLRVDYPELPLLDIKLSQGSASDLAFVKAFFTCDALLSTGKEFVHDHVVHILPQLRKMLNSLNHEIIPPFHEDFFVFRCDEKVSLYAKERLRLIKQLLLGYRRLIITKDRIKEGKVGKSLQKRIKKQLKKIEAALGAISDLFASANTEHLIHYKYLETHIEQFIWTENGWVNYWKKRFPEGIDVAEIAHVWREMGIIEEFHYQEKHLDKKTIRLLRHTL